MRIRCPETYYKYYAGEHSKWGFVRKSLNYITLDLLPKGPDILHAKSKNKLVWSISYKIRPKPSLFGSCFREFETACQSKLWKSSLQLVNTFKLLLACGDYIMDRCALRLRHHWHGNLLQFSRSRSDASKNMKILQSCFEVENEVVLPRGSADKKVWEALI